MPISQKMLFIYWQKDGSEGYTMLIAYIYKIDQSFNMKVVLVAFLAIIQTTLLCSPSLLGNSLQTDIMSLIPAQVGQTQFVYSFATPFATTPQLAIAVAGITMGPTSNVGAIAPRVSAIRTQASLTVNQFPSLTWTITKISLMASTNPQIFLDIVTANISNPSGSQLSQDISFNLSNPILFTVSGSTVLNTFFAGVASPTIFNYIKLTNSTLLTSTINVFVTTGPGFSGEVTVSVVAFAAFNTPTFSIYGGTYQAQNTGNYHDDVINQFSATQSFIFGLKKIDLSPSRTGQTTITSSIDNNFILEVDIVGPGSKFEVEYIFVGKTAQSICSNCASSNQGSIYSNGQCVSSCPPNTVLTTVGTGQLCRQCASALNQGYQNGICVPCGTGFISVNGLCQSNNGGTTCPMPNMVFNGQICVCASGYTLVGTICVQNNGGQCTGQYQLFDGSSCICTNGAFRDNIQNKCILCPAQSYWNGTACQCNWGLTLSNGVCVTASSTCPSGAYQNSAGVCVCSQLNYIIINGACQVDPNACPVAASRNAQGVCVCNDPSFIIHNNACVWNSGSNGNSGNVCPANAYKNGAGVCVCNQYKYVIINGECKMDPSACPEGASRNAQGVCVCNDPSFIIQNNMCIWSSNPNPSCPPNSSPNGQGTCTCTQANYIMQNNICVPSQTNACPARSSRNANGQCKCLDSQFVIVNNVCVHGSSSCPQQSYWNGTDCQCNWGLQKVNGVCI